MDMQLVDITFVRNGLRLQEGTVQSSL